jgi:hypothetical protein
VDRYRAEIAVRDGEVHVHTDLRKADECYTEAIVGALAVHCGFAFEELRKAGPPKPPDPRYPELTALIAKARTDWTRHGDELVRAVVKLLKAGKLLPMDATSEKALQALFADHRVKVQAVFAGHSSEQDVVERLIKRGLIDRDWFETADVAVSYRLGRGLEMLAVHRVNTSPVPPVGIIVKRALEVELSAEDREAIRYAQHRAALYMRRPANDVATEVERLLTEQELSTVRSTVALAVAENKSTAELERDLKDAVRGTTLLNNMNRVARTELAFAHSFGAYRALKEQAAGAGIEDPLVYKFVSPHACRECKRIWGPPASPHQYRLSHVEERERKGGNFRRPRAEWGPVIGPVHPHCTEGPLQFYDEASVDLINRAADELMATFGV